VAALKPGQSSSKTDPAPAGLFGYQERDVDEGGFFRDLAELEYRLVDSNGAEAQAWTVVIVDRDAANTDAVLDVKQGLYAPTITIPDPAAVGEWRIEWRFRVETGDPQKTSFTPLYVVAADHPIADGYVQVQEMLDEGVPVAMFTFTRIARAIKTASELFETWTGRHFEPRLITVDVDGEGSPIKQMGMPIIGLANVEFTFTTFSPADLPIEEGDLRVYNRHIRNAMTQPDDRDDPRIEFLRIENFRYPRETLLGDTDLLSSTIGFPLSQQNIKISGMFGFTDPDGSAFGRTPSLVKEAVMRIAMGKLQPLWVTTGGGANIGVTGPVASERTIDQHVTYGDLADKGTTGAFTGYFTGDPAIDQIISTFRRPPRLRSTSP